MTFITLCIITILSVLVCFLFFILIYCNSKGKIEIKIIKVTETKVGAIYSTFFFSIIYLSKINKEQSAVAIDHLLREKIETIIIENSADLVSATDSAVEKIEAETGCRVINIKTKVVNSQFYNWPKKIFSNN